MADNTVLSAGTGDGDTIATDDVAGVKYPISKLAHGALDSATLVTTSSGLPVQQQGDWVLAANSGVDIGDVDVASLPATVHSADFDTGGGTDTTLAMGIAVPASGGAAVVPGSATAGLKVDLGADNDVSVTGTVTVDGSGVTQPVSNAGLTELAAAINSSKLDINIASDGVGIGGGTQYTEDAAAEADPVGNALIMVRDDALSGQTTTDGDNIAARGTDKGELYVKHVDAIPVTQSGTWDEVGIHDSGNSITVDNAQLSVVGGGTEAAAMRVTIANDSTGVLSVDDNGSTLSVDDGGGALTVDGTVAVTNGGTFATQVDGAALTALQLIDDVVHVDDTATHATGTTKGVGIMAAATPTDGSVGANDIGMVAMTTDRKLHVAVMDALPAGTAAIGKLAANTGVDIGDVDVTSIVPGTGATNLGKAEDGGHTTGDVGVMALGVRVDSPNATVAADADYQYVAQDKVGGIRTALYETDFAVLGTKHVKKYYTNSGAVTDGIVWSPAAGARWYVTDIFINVSAAATVTLEDDKSGGDEVVWKAELAANSGWSHAFTTPLFSGEDAADLIVTTSAGNVYITITGYEI